MVIVITSMLTKAIPVAVVVVVPVMVVFNPASLAHPISAEIAPAFVVVRSPMRSRVGRQSPVAGVPAVVASNRIPVAINPEIVGPGANWPRGEHPWRRWRPDLDADGNLCTQQAGKDECRKQQQSCLHNSSISTKIAKAASAGVRRVALRGPGKSYAAGWCRAKPLPPRAA